MHAESSAVWQPGPPIEVPEAPASRSKRPTLRLAPFTSRSGSRNSTTTITVARPILIGLETDDRHFPVPALSIAAIAGSRMMWQKREHRADRGSTRQLLLL